MDCEVRCLDSKPRLIPRIVTNGQRRCFTRFYPAAQECADQRTIAALSPTLRGWQIADWREKIADQGSSFPVGQKSCRLVFTCIAPWRLTVLGDEASWVCRCHFNLTDMVEYPFDKA